MRPILIVLLVLYHAFCTWTGAWKPFEGFEPNEIYKWIADFSYSFMLPMFVFQSGYIWAFQHDVKGRRESLKQLSIKKCRRLIIPSILFSFAYLLIFNQQQISGENSLHMIYSISCGVAHMWFLPMLFWCFIISWFLLKINSLLAKYVVVTTLTIISIISMPLMINVAFSYILYFQLGYDIFTQADKIRQCVTIKRILISWCMFTVIFVSLTILKDNLTLQINQENSKIAKVLMEESSILFTIIYSVLGIFAMYVTAIYYTFKHSLSEQIIKIGSLCFGVYLFQQFILIALYRHTELPIKLGLSLPWISFILALSISLVLSYFLRLTPLGKKLI